MLIRQLVAAFVLSAFARDVASLAAVVAGFGRLRAVSRNVARFVAVVTC